MTHVRWLEDASRARSLADVRRDAHGWAATDKLAPGFSRSIWWVRLRVENPTPVAQSLVLDLRQPLLDHVHWYVIDETGTLVFHQASGDRVPFRQRPLAYRDLALPLTLPPHGQREIFMQLDAHDGLFDAANPVLHDAEGFRATSNEEGLLNGMYFGALLALTLYNLLVWLSIRERTFGLYVLYAGSFFLWSFTFRGFGFELLWPDAPDFNNQILAITAATSFIGCGCFGVRYLRLSERAPRWQLRTVQTLIALNLLTIPLAIADRYAWAFAWCIPAGLAIVVFVVGVSFDQARRGSREGWLYGGSFLPLGVGVAIKLLQIPGIVPHRPWLDWIWQAGSAFEMLFLALCLAEAMNRLKAQKLIAERSARAVQAQLAAGLEQQVRERTLALEAANERLREMSITDALTGAFNRRHFDQRCRDLLGDRRRVPASLALCMIDLDFFKAYNDHHGHQAGDRALGAVVGAVRGLLRREGDQLFRLGGEEFGVLFLATSEAQAASFAEELRLAVRALALPHGASSGSIVTASFGVAFWSDAAMEGLTPDAMYAHADRLLYAAKSAGRDRVVAAAMSAGRLESAH